MVRIFWPRVTDLLRGNVTRNDVTFVTRYASHAQQCARECERTYKLVSDTAGRQSLIRQALDAEHAAKAYRRAVLGRLHNRSSLHL